ncbi:MAG: signal peptidase I [Candidatus Azotimanducaceae bacterium]|jgi:signal peptidase I
MTAMQWLIFFIVIQVIHFIGTWKLYEKAGRKWWEAVIPIYNGIVLMSIINRPKWWVILLFIPVVNLIMFPIVWIETIRSFGKYSRIDSLLVIFTLGFYIYYINYFTNVEHIKDRSIQPRSSLGEWVSSIAFAIIAATLVHTYFMRPYVIPTSSLEKSLLIGDYLLVSKFHYGARVPMTPIALPMVHDSIPFTGLRSYLKKPQLPYYRLPALEKIKRNEIVVFNWPADSLKWMWNDYSGKYTYKPIDKKTNYVKRCVAIPGDSLQIIDGTIYINGEQSIMPDRAKPQYYYTLTGNEGFTTENFPSYINAKARKRHYKIKKEYWNDTRVQDAFKVEAYLTKVGEDSLYVEVAGGVSSNLISRLNIISVPNRMSVNLTQEEVDKIKKESNTQSIERLIHSNNDDIFPQSDQYKWSQDNFGPIYIPKKGETVKLDSKSIPFYEHLINEYERNNITVDGDTVFINGKIATDYTFKQDYYWMMGDNRHMSLDARFWGYTPFDHVIGKPVFIWMSYDGGIFRNPRWERFFTTVHGTGKPVSYFYYFLGLLALWIGYSTFIKKKKE